MSIVKSINKKTGIIYVYESESYWDPVKKQPRNHRKLIGKLDEDGNIVPTGKSGRKKQPAAEVSGNGEFSESIAYYRDKCRELETENHLLTDKIRKLEKEKAAILNGLEKLLEQIRR